MISPPSTWKGVDEGSLAAVDGSMAVLTERQAIGQIHDLGVITQPSDEHEAPLVRHEIR